jgi:hypothetical protein
MFVVLYRWRVKANFERQFIKAWTERTAYLFETYDSLGSRLHEGSDGIWYSYAQWKSAEQREQAFAAEAGKVPESRQKFQEAIEEEFAEVELEIVSDYLILPKDA